jgi:putative DNA primase/helicase
MSSDAGNLLAPAQDDIVVEAANLPDVVDAATRLLAERASGVYQRGDVVVGFVDDEALREMERPYRIVALDADALAQRVNRVASTWRRDRKTGELRRVNFPPAIARTILAERRFAFAPLDAVVEAPLVTLDGQLLDRPGYSRGLLLHFAAEDFRRLRDETPTPDDVDAAIGYLRELLRGFPFVDLVAESVAIAALITAVLRPALPAAPGFAITATAPGTGKTHLARLVGMLATGREPGLMSWPGDEVEFRKQALAALLAGEAVFAIDNINGVLRSDTMCVLLTAPIYTQRLLGGNDAVSVPTRTLMLANGNNLTVAGDLVRRMLVCRLDAGVERPELREFGFDPLARMRDERPDVVRAVLAIVRAYLASGDRMRLDPYAGYDEWSNLVRAPMTWAGLPDPVRAIEIAAELDPDRQALEAMLVAVRDIVDRTEFDVPALVQTACAHVLGDDAGNARRAALRLAIEEVATRNGEINIRALGRWLAAVEGRIALGMRFVRRRERTRVGVKWAVEMMT